MNKKVEVQVTMDEKDKLFEGDSLLMAVGNRQDENSFKADIMVGGTLSPAHIEGLFSGVVEALAQTWLKMGRHPEELAMMLDQCIEKGITKALFESGAVAGIGISIDGLPEGLLQMLQLLMAHRDEEDEVKQ